MSVTKRVLVGIEERFFGIDVAWWCPCIDDGFVAAPVNLHLNLII